MGSLKKGFTLVEVLAVIILLGLIAVIIVPNYNRSIESSKQNSYIESLNGLVRSIENYIASNGTNSVTSTFVDITSLDLDADNLNQIQSGQVKFEDNIIVLKDVYNGSYCGNGSKNNFTVTKGTC